MRSSLVTEALVAGRNRHRDKAGDDRRGGSHPLYMSHYRPLVRLAVLLVRDEPTAEEVVQECSIAMHDGWHRLRDGDKALSYLEQAVVNRSKSVLRHRSAAARAAPGPAPGVPGCRARSVSQLERSVVVAALQRLPDRQRQALVLRYYTDLSEAQIAEMMGIAGVRSRATRRGAWHRCAPSWKGSRNSGVDCVVCAGLRREVWELTESRIGRFRILNRPDGGLHQAA